VEVLEQRVLYSADALGSLMPLLLSDDTEEIPEIEALDFLANPDPINLYDQTYSAISSIVFVDHAVPDADLLIDAIDQTSTKIVLIAADEDGLDVITRTLQHHSDLNTVQVISHGSSGELVLGASRITLQTLVQEQDTLAQWSDALSDDADLLLLGCDVAGGAEGRQFVEFLSNVTNADVAASIDSTGNASSNADWDLEYATGQVDAAAMPSGLSLEQWDYVLATITVDIVRDQFSSTAAVDMATLLAQQSDGREVSLREAIYASNQGPASQDTIVLPEGDYKLSISPFLLDDDDDEGIFGDLDLDGDLTIIGEGAAKSTIEQEVDVTRVMEIQTGSVRLENIEIFGGTSVSGAGIHAAAGSTVTLVNSTVSGNTTSSRGGGIYSDGIVVVKESSAISGNTMTLGGSDGGGLYVTGQLTISESSVVNNRSYGNGAGIYADNLVIEKSLVESNSAGGNGGGLYAEGEATLSDSAFHLNDARNDGGGIFADADYSVTRVGFTENKSLEADGGGLFGGGSGVVIDSSFGKNLAADDGAGLYVTGDVDISLSSFYLNQASSDGGAIYADQGHIVVSQTGFNDNVASDRGGAVWGRESITVEKSSFVKNTALLERGGAIFHSNAGTLSVNNVTFAYNRAVEEGAIYNEGLAYVSYSSFVGNRAGTETAAIGSYDNANGDNFLELTTSLFEDNLVDGGGSMFNNVITLGYNLYDVIGASTDIDQNNGRLSLGPMTTVDDVSAFPLLPGSDAINAARTEPDPTTDSQGFKRDEISDIGASEANSDVSVAYWSSDTGMIYRSNTDFTNVQEIVKALEIAEDLVVDMTQKRVVWLDDDRTKVVSATLDRSDTITPVLAGLSDATSIAVDSAAAYLYVGLAGANPRIEQYDNAGVLRATVASGLQVGNPVDMTVHGPTGSLFWVDAGSDSVNPAVLSYDPVNDTVETLASSPSPQSVAINSEGTHVYWTDKSTDEVGKLEVSTGAITRLSTVIAPDPDSLDFDAEKNKPLWLSESSDKVIGSDADLRSEALIYESGAVMNDISLARTSSQTVAPSLVTHEILAVDENNSVVIDDNVLLSADPDNNDDEVRFIITKNPLQGVVVVDGLKGAVEFTQQQASDGLVKYKHAGEENISDQLEFELHDGVLTSDRYKLDIVVKPVNAPPVLSSSTSPVVTEGGKYQITHADLQVVDEDNVAAEFGYRFIDVLQYGELLLNGNPLEPGDIFTYADIDNNSVEYQHRDDSVAADSIKIVVSDGVADSNPVTLVFGFVGVNDPPDLSILSTPILTEGGEYTLTSGELSANDVDNTSDAYQYRYTSDLLHGTIKRGEDELPKDNTFTHAELNAGQLVYEQFADASVADTIDFVVSDGMLDSVPATLVFDYVAVNDAPTLVAGPRVELSEADFHPFTTDDLVAGDEDNDPSDYVYRLVSDPSQGSMVVDGIALAQGDTFTQANLQAAQVIYHHRDDAEAADNLQFVVSDGEADSGVATFTFNYTAVNDRPVLTSATTPALTEGDEYSLTVADLSVNDVDNDTGDYAYKYTSELLHGQIKLAGNVLTQGATFTHAELSGGQVVYIQFPDASVADTIDFVVSDGMLDSVPATVVFDYVAVNDAPTLVAGPRVELAEADFHTFTTDDLMAGDEDNDPSEYVYRLVSDPSMGYMEVDGNILAQGDTFTQADLQAAQVIYHHRDDAETADDLQFLVSDGEADSGVATFTFNYTAVNDRPVLLIESAPELTEGGTYILTTQDLTITDVDSDPEDYQYRYQFELAQGYLSRHGEKLEQWDYFTYAELSDSQIAYHHEDDSIASDSIVFVVSDGLDDSLPSSLIFDYQAVDDSPELNPTASDRELPEGGRYTLLLSDLGATDKDSPDSTFVYQFSTIPENGVMEVSGEPISENSTFTHTQLSSGDVIYRHGGDETKRDRFSIVVSDGFSDSGMAAVSLNIVPVNDVPVLKIAESVQIEEGGSHRFDQLDLVASDSDNALSTLHYRYTELFVNGIIEVADRPLSSGDSFTHEQLQAGHVVYRHNGSEAISDTAGFTVSDSAQESASQRVMVEVLPTNDLPSVTLTGSSVAENNPGAVIGYLVISDPDLNDTHRVEVTESGANDSASSRFLVNDGTLALKEGVALDFEQEQQVDLRLTVIDSADARVSEDIKLTVLNTNDAPVILIEPTTTAGDGYQLPESSVVDLDGDELKYSATLDNGDPLPDWLVFNVVEQSFAVALPDLVVSELAVRITADDGNGGQTSIPLVLLFDPPLAAATPVVTPAVELPEFTANTANTANTVNTNPQIPETVGNAVTLVDNPQPKNTVAEQGEKADEFIGHVDLHSLITPLQTFGSLELAVLGDTVSGDSSESSAGSIANDMDSFNLSDLLNQPSSAFVTSSGQLNEAMDNEQAEQLNRLNMSQALIGSSAGLTTGLSVGYLIWLIRGGTLMGSMLSSLPAWRFVDPLPVLSSLGDSDDDDDETLASMVDVSSDKSAKNATGKKHQLSQSTSEDVSRPTDPGKSE